MALFLAPFQPRIHNAIKAFRLIHVSSKLYIQNILEPKSSKSEFLRQYVIFALYCVRGTENTYGG